MKTSNFASLMNLAFVTKSNSLTRTKLNMANPFIYGSLTRISDIPTKPFDLKPLCKSKWNTGDYVVSKYVGNSEYDNDWVELATGRHRPLKYGDLVVGSLGMRRSTLEAVGDWHLVGEDNKMQDICGSGMFGVETSNSSRQPNSPTYIYKGHVIRVGQKVCMKDFAQTRASHSEAGPILMPCPLILIMGTSMSCGKTITARTIIPILKDLGVDKVVGTKFTGAGFLHDIESMADAGADEVYDFVDVGIPSTVIPESDYRESLRNLLSILASRKPDVIVAEMGASPCEPYNGMIVLEEIKPDFIVLCASDPYAVIGLKEVLKNSFEFDLKPNIVTGITATTTAGIELVQELTGIQALNLSSESSIEKLRMLLENIIPKRNKELQNRISTKEMSCIEMAN